MSCSPHPRPLIHGFIVVIHGVIGHSFPWLHPWQQHGCIGYFRPWLHPWQHRGFTQRSHPWLHSRQHHGFIGRSTPRLHPWPHHVFIEHSVHGFINDNAMASSYIWRRRKFDSHASRLHRKIDVLVHTSLKSARRTSGQWIMSPVERIMLLGYIRGPTTWCQGTVKMSEG